MATTRSVAAAANTATGTLTINRPAGTADGDLLVAVLFFNQAGSATLAGWTALSNGSDASASGYTTLWKRAGGSEPSSYSFSVPAASNVVGVVAAFTEAADPLDAETAENRVSTAANTVGGVTAGSVGLLTGFWLILSGSRSISTPPSGMTQRHLLSSTYSAAVYDEAIAAGATGTRSLTWDAGASHAAVLLAIGDDNQPPNAPTLLTPIGGATIDKDVDQVFDWDFSDPDSGDTQSAYEFRYRLFGAGSWTTTGQVASTSTQRTVVGGTFAAGTYEWQVKTWDQDGEEGSFSASETYVAAAAPSPPTITDPASGGTVNTDPYTVAWSTPTQTAYQVRTVADSGGSPDTGTIYTDTGEVTSTARSVSVAFATQQWEHVQVRVKSGGLWSSWASHRVNVSYTPPPTPTFTLTATNNPGNITVAITNPAPGAGEPDVTGNDIYRQTSGTDDGVRIAANVAPNGSYIDEMVANRGTYEYWVVALGDNGTTTTSATSDVTIDGGDIDGFDFDDTLDGGTL